MKTTRSLSLMLAPLALAVAATVAPAVASAQAGKIAVIRMQSILEAPSVKANADRARGDFERRRTDLDARIKQFQADVERYQKDKPTLSPTEVTRREKDLSARQIDLQQADRQFQEDAQKRSNELLADIDTRVSGVIAQIAREQNIDLVLGQGVVFAAPALDITDTVISRLGSAPAAPGTR